MNATKSQPSTVRRKVLGLAAIVLLVAPVVLFAQVTNSLPTGPGGLVIQGNTLKNKIEEHLPNPPAGTLIFTLNPGCPWYQVNQFTTGGWVDPNQRLVPGQGVLTWNPGQSTNLLSDALPVAAGQYSPAQNLNLMGLLAGDSLPVGAAFDDSLHKITVVSNSWQISRIATALPGGWSFEGADESTLRNGAPFFFETYDPVKPFGDCSPGVSDGDILLNSYAPSSDSTGGVGVDFYGETHYWPSWLAQMYGATATNGPFVPLGPLLEIQPAGINGKVVLPGPQAFPMPGIGSGQEFFLELRVWDTFRGRTYEAADLASSYGHGRSPPRRFVARSDNFLPPTLVNLNEFSVQLLVPLTPPLEIIGQPASQFIATGAAAIFEAWVESSYPHDVALQWQKLNLAGIWEDLLGKTTEILDFPAAAKGQQGDYRLRATARLLDGSSALRISQVARLSVANPPALEIVNSSPSLITLSITADPEFTTKIERRSPVGVWELWIQLPKGSSQQTFQLQPGQPSEVFRARTFP